MPQLASSLILLMQLRNYRSLIFFVAFFLAPSFIIAQAGDTSKVIQIINARSMRMRTQSDGTALQMLAGNAMVRQGNTLLSGDSIAFSPATGIAEVFGNVHINDADTVHTYAQYLRYVGTERIAYLKRNVKFTDGRGTLYTDELEYNLQTGIANYR